MVTLEQYEATGFTPEQIIRMYKNLCETQDIISRLVCGDENSILEAISDALYWLDGFASYSKEGLH